ncbi:MAG: methylated-DNA--[protein]-cysteine S-methyltransferase [Planctomycetaceae bacterium]|jgi:AraC family transcriptional regulator of adaptative response/methylated-DNA-[protein]-cysteine methyltransferase|nr:methylated-DNA--[protein]-cysteine S-methyltransferase [Planctomycetaceae bacterium]
MISPKKIPIDRLIHDSFVQIERMAFDEYQNGGKNLAINYSMAESPFGKLMVASTAKGVCFLAFEDNEKQALDDLKSRFPHATYQKKSDEIQHNALLFSPNVPFQPLKILLHLNATDFQLKVWKSLLKIPMGELSTYSEIAKKIGNPKAPRAVGNAVGRNPVAFWIPCHRVIRLSGGIGGYRWGIAVKTALMAWEKEKASND